MYIDAKAGSSALDKPRRKMKAMSDPEVQTPALLQLCGKAGLKTIKPKQKIILAVYTDHCTGE